MPRTLAIVLTCVARQRVLGAVLPFLPAALVFGVLFIWVEANGGYFAQTWYPSAIGAVSLLAVTLTAGRGALPPRRAARIALLAFAALVALNYLSMLWAHSPGSAWEASNKLLLYLAAAWTIALLPWTPRVLAGLLGAWSVGIAIVCAIGLIGAVTSSHLDPYFVEFRYAEPMKYSNATAALAAMALWPALILSARRGVPVWLQAALLSVAVFLADFALLPQSRAALLGIVLVTPVALALVSGRLRLLARVAVVGAGLAVSVPRTVNVDRAANSGHHVASLLHDAAVVMLLSAVGAAIIAVLFAVAERKLAPILAERWARRRFPRLVRGPRAAGRGWLVAAASALVIVVSVVVALDGGAIGHAARKEWRGLSGGSGGARLFSTAPEERLDYLRVGLRLFRGAPIGGVGAGNFGLHYDAMRHYAKHSQYTHDLVLRALSETGVAGFAILLAIVASLATATIGAVRQHDGLARACAASTLAVAAYFLVHDSLDWLDEFPALAVPALAFPLAASAIRVPNPSSRSSLGYRRLAAVGAFVVAAAFALLPPYFATRYIGRAYASYRIRPASAFDDLRRAAALNPLAIGPLAGKGTIAIALGQPQTARAAFTAALKREDNWYPRLELALLDAQAGQFGTALQALDRAASLDANDPIISEARTMIEHHQRIDPVRFNQLTASEPQFTLLRRQTIK